MRSASVLRPRSARNESNGPWMAPTAFCRNVSRSAQLGIVADDRHAADHVGMAVEIFGGRMHDQVEAVARAGAAHRGWRRCCRRRSGCRAACAIVGDALEIDELEQRIGRRLDPDQARVRPDRGFERAGIGEVDDS